MSEPKKEDNKSGGGDVGGVKLDAEKIAKPFRLEVQNRVKELTDAGFEAPKLVGLLANTDPAARKYAEWTGKACRNDGLQYELRTISDPIDVEPTLLSINDDPSVHGIIVYYPIFGQVQSFSGSSQDDYLRDTIDYRRDVEGLCHLYRTNLYRNVRFLDRENRNKCLLPCTALSVVKILEYLVYDKKKPVRRQMEGKVVTVINRSEIVGRPLAAMLANDGAEVYSVDIDSVYIFKGGRLHMCEDTPEMCVKKSSVIITGVPTKAYRLNTEWIQQGSTLVNVSSFKNVDETKLLQIPGVTYVPKVGKVTVAMLERNLVRLYENFHSQDRRRTLSNRGIMAEEEEDNMKNPSVDTPWYGSLLQVYTAVAVSALLAMTLLDRRKK